MESVFQREKPSYHKRKRNTAVIQKELRIDPLESKRIHQFFVGKKRKCTG